MIYTDLEKIYKTRNIENKYALAMIVSMRARQLSEQKGRALDGGGSELFITYALGEVSSGDLKVSKRSAIAPVVQDETNEADEAALAPDILETSETAGVSEFDGVPEKTPDSAPEAHADPDEAREKAEPAFIDSPIPTDEEKLTAADVDENIEEPGETEEAESEDGSAVDE